MPNFVGNALMAHAQGGCFRCHRGSDLVDMDAYVEGEGALALCTGCIRDAAIAGGLTLNAAAIAEIKAAHAEDRRLFAPERVAELEAEVAELTEALHVKSLVDERLEHVLDAASKRGRKVSV